MSEKWDWTISNGSATAEATAAAYAALTGNGLTAEFMSPVWNDILDKISAQRLEWEDSAWDRHTPSLANTRMSPGYIMTAVRFNTAVKNIPVVRAWPWQNTLRRADIKPGDRCYGIYFIYLTDGINHWIDLIPMPWKMINTLTSSITVDSHALPSIPIKAQKPLKVIWKPEIATQLDPSVPIKQQLEVCHDKILDVQVFDVNHVIIVNFSHVVFHNQVSLHPTAHAISGIDVLIQDQYRVSLGECDSVNVDLPFTYTATGAISSDTLLSIIANIAAGVFDLSAAVRTAQCGHVAFNLVARIQGEAYAREWYSLPLSTAFSATESIHMALCCQRINAIITSWILSSSVTAALSTTKSYDLASVLQYATNMFLRMSALIRQLFKANLIDTFSLGASALIDDCIATGATFDDQIILSANVQALERFFAATNIIMQSEVNTEGHCSKELHSGADILSAQSLSAGLDTNVMQVINALLSGELNLTATGETLRPDSITAAFSDETSFSAAVLTWLPTLDFSFTLASQSTIVASIIKAAEVLPLLASIISNFSGSAQMGLIARLALCVTAAFQYTCSADITLSTAHAIFAAVTGQHSGSATMSYVTTQPIKGNLHTVHTVTSSVSFLAPTLVSEIENDLVSDLDDVLVADVEFSMH